MRNMKEKSKNILIALAKGDTIITINIKVNIRTVEDITIIEIIDTTITIKIGIKSPDQGTTETIDMEILTKEADIIAECKQIGAYR